MAGSPGSPAEAATSQGLERSAFGSLDTGRLSLIQGLSGLVGRKVRDINEYSVGKFEDVLLDLPRGEVLAALISPGGDQVIPVPPATFHAVSKDKILVNADHKLFKSAPRLLQPGGGGGSATGGVKEAYRHFQRPAPDDDDMRKLDTGAVLLGKPVVGSDNEALGVLQDVMVDLAVGRIVYIVVQPAPGPETERNLYLAPPAAVKWDATARKVVLAASRARFLAGPHFQKSFCTDMIQPELAAAVYGYYLPEKREPKSGMGEMPAPAAIAQTTPESATTTGAPSRSDSEVTKAVMMEILNEGKITLRGDVQITTRQGRVKLAGMARSEKEKHFVVEAARRVVGAPFIDDSLLVKGKNMTAQVP